MQYIRLNKHRKTAFLSGIREYQLLVCRIVERELQEAYAQGAARIVVDLKGTCLLTSAALKQLVKIRERVRPENFRMRHARGWTLASLRDAHLESWLEA